MEGSGQVSDDEEHEDAGQEHSSDHDELVLGGSSLDQSHHCVRQAQHVGHVQHLLVGSLWRHRRTYVNSEPHTCTMFWKVCGICMTTSQLSALIRLILGRREAPTPSP